jgi:four helix bundle protein
MASDARYSFKSLDRWKAAQKFGVDATKLADSLPNRRSADILARQLIRSSTSIAANIAEGHARYSLGAYRNHLSIAKGSAAESEHWLDLLVQLGHVSEEIARPLEGQCVALMGALTRSIVALERQEGTGRIRESSPGYDAGSDLVPWFDGSLAQDDAS